MQLDLDSWDEYTLRVLNLGPQSHMIQFVRLLTGPKNWHTKPCGNTKGNNKLCISPGQNPFLLWSSRCTNPLSPLSTCEIYKIKCDNTLYWENCSSFKLIVIPPRDKQHVMAVLFFFCLDLTLKSRTSSNATSAFTLRSNASIDIYDPPSWIHWSTHLCYLVYPGPRTLDFSLDWLLAITMHFKIHFKTWTQKLQITEQEPCSLESTLEKLSGRPQENTKLRNNTVVQVQCRQSFQKCWVIAWIISSLTNWNT